MGRSRRQVVSLRLDSDFGSNKGNPSTFEWSRGVRGGEGQQKVNVMGDGGVSVIVDVED